MSVAVASRVDPARPAPVNLTADHLTPGPGLRRESDGWHADGSTVTFTAEAAFTPGWYRFRFRFRSHDKITLNKRVELAFHTAASSRPVVKDALPWQRALDCNFLVELPLAATRLTVTLAHAEGQFGIDQFSVRRIPGPLVGLTAVGEKVKLLTAFNCLAPVLWRGTGMLLRGKFAEFGRKVLKGLRDSRIMHPGEYQASDADGGWWRRHTLPEAEAARVRAAVNALPSPPTVAVLLPVDPKRFDEARATAQTVRRQLYPHWELLLACAGPPSLRAELASLIGIDPRATVSLAGEGDGLEAAVARGLAATSCERVLVLPPGVELAEDALYRFVEHMDRDPDGQGFAAPMPDALSAETNGRAATPAELWLTRTDRLSDRLPADLSPGSLGEWVAAGVSPTGRRTIPRPLSYALQAAPLCDRGRVGPPPAGPTDQLTLAADLTGITGWNHIGYALLRGLPSVGVQLTRHPLANIDANLVPPNAIPPVQHRRPNTPTLVVSPPFGVSRFEPDARTAVFTMWETDTLTPADAAKLNAAGLVIVPSRWQVDSFRRSGVTVPMEVAPLGYDPLVFHDDGSYPAVCTFGTAGALVAGGVRKNAQRMIDLFRQAFPTEPDVRLRVKISPNSPAVDTCDDPRIDLIWATLPYPQLAAWYRSLSAYLNGSFGEGFGLHLIEAMACGRPVISTDYSGLTAFFDPGVGYAVGHTLVPVSNEVYTGRWAEPDEAGLVARMREVYADPADARRRGRLAASRAANFTWRKSGRKVVAVLRKHGLLPAAGEPDPQGPRVARAAT